MPLTSFKPEHHSLLVPTLSDHSPLLTPYSAPLFAILPPPPPLKIFPSPQHFFTPTSSEPHTTSDWKVLSAYGLVDLVHEQSMPKNLVRRGRARVQEWTREMPATANDAGLRVLVRLYLRETRDEVAHQGLLPVGRDLEQDLDQLAPHRI